MIEFRKVTNETFRECVDLSPGEGGEKFVAPNAISLAQAFVVSDTKACTPIPYAIYNDEMMVGFIMMSYVTKEQDEEAGEDYYELWRFMIDEKYQGKGYGKESLMKALELLRTKPCGDAQRVYLSYVPGNEVAEALYRMVGFLPTGGEDDGEIIMSCVL